MPELKLILNVISVIIKWKSTPHNLLQGYGCPSCNLSKGEKYIKSFLEENNFIYDIQFTNSNCKYIRNLFFDFVIFKNIQDKIDKTPWILIEYDGEQHWQPMRYCKDESKSISNLQLYQKRDQIKNNYCKQYNISLIRIQYKKEYKQMNLMAKHLIYNELQHKLNELIKT